MGILDQQSKDLIIKQSTRIRLIAGGRSMVDGMNYHHRKFSGYYESVIDKLEEGVNRISPANAEYMKHEAIAYLNRLGQFFYFMTSEAITRVLGDNLEKITLTIKRSIWFRHKQTAHRASDKPRKEDLNVSWQWLDDQFSFLSHFSGDRMVFEVELNDETKTFDIIEEHPKIIFEARKVLELLEKATL